MMRTTGRGIALALAGVLAGPAAAQQGLAPPADTYYGYGLPPWQGWYVGGHAGYGDADPGDGFLGGVQAGYAWQAGRLIYGLEADVTWADINHDETIAICPGPAGCVSTRLETSIDWMATLRARLGYLVQPDLMPYVTAGFGLVSSSASASMRVAGFAFTPISDDDTETDFVYGAGFEGRLGPASLVRIEYLGFSDTGIDVIRAGLSFRLGN